MTDTGQPYSAAAAKLVARHSKKVEKKVYNPEPDFNRIFLKDANHALRPLPHTAIEKLDGRGLLELDKFMNNVHGDRFRMTDAPHTCAACAMQFTENQYAPPCIWEIRGPINRPVFDQACVCCVLKNRENDCCTIPAFFGENIEAAIALCDVVQAGRDRTRNLGYGPEGLDHALATRYVSRRDYFEGLKNPHPKNGSGTSVSNKRKRSLDDIGDGLIKTE